MHTSLRRHTFLVPCLFLVGACRSTQPIQAWQQRLTDYTMKEGHGDPNILRESAELRSPDSARPAQIRFDQTDIAAEGLPPFADRADVHGVMVGQHSDNGNPVFYFLVGVVKRPSGRRGTELKDIRLVSCALREGKHSWRTGPPNPESLHRYLGSERTRAEMSRNPSFQTFPRIEDDFRMEVQGGVAKATETRSGATWILPLD